MRNNLQKGKQNIQNICFIVVNNISNILKFSLGEYTDVYCIILYNP